VINPAVIETVPQETVTERERGSKFGVRGYPLTAGFARNGETHETHLTQEG